MPEINSTTHQSLVLRKKVKRFAKIGGLLAGIGGFITVGFPMLLSAGMASDMGFTLKEGNEITKAWMDVPLPIFNSIYIFNIENPDEYRRGAKPRVREMGPYVYKQHRWKEVISWAPDGKSVKFYSISSWTFDQEKSTGTQNDKITVVNVPVYAMSAVVRGLISKLPLSFAIAPVVFVAVDVLFLTHGEGLLKELTVGEFVEGYPFTILNTIDVVTKPLTWFGIKLPDNGMPGNKFGLLHVKNYTKSPPIEMFTGREGTKPFLWKTVGGKRAMDFYNDPKCDTMRGTDGTSMGTFLNKDDVLYVYNPDACRSIYATYKGLSSVAGIPAWRYVLPKSMFASPATNPDNKCFCQTPNDYDLCDGIFDLGPCQMGAPLAFSFPHLMFASAKIKAGVEGLSPDILKHESFFDVEPTLGVPLAAAGRLQINLLMKPNRLLIGFGGIPEGVLPLIWMEEGAAVEGKFEWMMKGAIYPMLAVDYGSFFALLGGLSLLGYTSVFAFNRRKILYPRNEEKDPNTQTKDPYSVSGRMANNGNGYNEPPLYNISQQQYNKPQQMGTQTQPINGMNGHNPNQQRVSWSPPGALE